MPSSESTSNVELAGGRVYEIVGAGDGWAAGLRPGADGVRISRGAAVSGATIDVAGAKISAAVDDDPLGILESRVRNTTGTRSVLAVRVIHEGAGNGALTLHNGQYAPEASKEAIADKIFGAAVGSSDEANLHDQVTACSHEKLRFRPADDRAAAHPAIATDIADGACEVRAATPCDAERGAAVLNDLSDALSAGFGASEPAEIADHVMHCFPDGAMGGILAAAMTPGWQTWYSNE